MIQIQEIKEQVWDFWEALEQPSADRASILETYCHHNVVLNGPHPINDLADPAGIEAGYLQPLYQAFPDLRREPYIYMAGKSFDDTSWVSSTGNFVGTFDQDWLGIPANKETVKIRYGEFYKFWGDKIGQIYLMLDIPEFCLQLGVNLFPPSRGEAIEIPGPEANDGLLIASQATHESRESFELINRMLFGLSQYDQLDKLSMGQAQFWRDDMRWYGPGGIGSTQGLSGFEEQHQLPWLEAYPDRKGGHHKARFGDGRYACSIGWPSMYATSVGPFLGLPATNERVSFRVMDWWSRTKDRLHENWVFVDLLDLAQQCGVDPLKETFS